MTAETLLGIAQRHVREGTVRINRQKVIVERQKATGYNSEVAEALLNSFEQAQKEHLRRLRQQMAECVLVPSGGPHPGTGLAPTPSPAFRP